MSRSRKLTAAAIALLLAALAAAGCGLGPGKGLGDASLTVTREFGARQVGEGETTDSITEADTVMRVLERNAEIETRYSGGFVQSIDGLEADEGGAGPEDWFFYVNGVESDVGAAQYPLHGGESIWWDYHDWGSAIHIPAVVGAYPEPFLDGYEGERHPVSVVCRDSAEICQEVSDALGEEGVRVDGAARPPSDAIRVLVGTWERIEADPAAAQIARGPQSSGVFAKFEGQGAGCRLEALDEAGQPTSRLGSGAGLLAATRRYEAPPTWILSGCEEAGVAEAVKSLRANALRDHFAVIAEGGPGSKSLPVPMRGS